MRKVVNKKVEIYVTKDKKELFNEWLEQLKDRKARILIDKTIAKIRLGNLGNHKSVGEGVQEIILNYGPGYRIYFAEHGSLTVLLLCGSTKQRQQKIINLAKLYWKDWKRRGKK